MRSFLLYLMLVGLPGLGVAGALHLGQDIKPATRVNGVWNLELQAPIACDPDCLHRKLAAAQSTLNVSQSGPHLTITVDNQPALKLEGAINGATISARDRDSAWFLEATVSGDSTADRLTGKLIVARCKTVNGLQFTAVHQLEEKRHAGGH